MSEAGERDEASGTAPTSETKPAKPKRDEEPESFDSIARTVGSALLIAILIRILVFELFEIDGPSMEATLLHEDRVVVLKYTYGLWLPTQTHALTTWSHPEPGDVIILNSPMDDQDLVKRVVGVPGDVIEVRDGIVIRNGVEIPQRDLGPCPEDQQREPVFDCHVYEERLNGHVYRTTRASFGRDTLGPVTVPAGHVYVLGDHRDRSNDSREPRVGPIPFSRVKGRAVMVLASGSFLRGEVRWNRFFHGIE